jgi:NADPH:quinone reductase-like Zn-dependent oxidoreductase
MRTYFINPKSSHSGEVDKYWRLENAATPEPGHGQVLVAWKAVSLNYRDLLVAASFDRPDRLIPCSDGAGIVAAVGPGVSRFAIGDRVAALFFQGWLDGPIRAEVHNTALGGAIDGVLTEYSVLSEAGLVKLPEYLSFEAAAALPCAAVTAWNALVELAAIKPGQTVLLIGTGGVSIFALQFAKAAGARVFLISSSDQKIEQAKRLGADACVNYRTHPEWGAWANSLTGGVGVDLVIDVGGAGTLEQSLIAARHAGIVTINGVLTGIEGRISPLPALMKSLRLQGVYVGSRAMFERMLAGMELHRLQPVIDRIFDFDGAPSALAHLKSAQHVGKIIVRVSR